MPREELLDGVEIMMGGKKWTIPPLTLKQIKKFSGTFQDLVNLDTSNIPAMATGAVDAAVDIIHAAIVRNYPELTRDELEDLIDLRNLAPVMQAVLGMSGLLGEAGAGSR